MKILILSDCPTHPTTAGNRKLILEYCTLFQRWGHDVHYLYVDTRPLRKGAFVESRKAEAETKTFFGDRFHEFEPNALSNFWRIYSHKFREKICGGFTPCDDIYPMGLSKYVRKLNEELHFDAIIVNYMWMSKVLVGLDIPRKALFTHDYFSYKNILISRNADHACHANEEAKAMQRAPYIFAMQDEEAAFFQRLSPKSRVLINYANYDYHEQPIVGNHNIMFLSGPNEFNVNGIKWFVNDILPLLVEAYSDLKLIIGGAICDVIKDYSDNTNIELQGYIDDVSAFFAQGDVAINPTFEGTGLKIKTFESMSYDKVVMVHPHSTIGVYKKDSAPLFSSNEPNEWVNFLKRIWNNTKEMQEIKSQTHKYLNEMNDFIKMEYKKFLEI